MRFISTLAILVTFPVTMMCEEEKDHEFSSRTQYYLREHQKDLESLQKKYLEDVENVNADVVKKLEVMLKRALQRDELEEALALKKKIKEIQSTVKRDMLGEVIIEKEKDSENFTNKTNLQIGKATWGLKGGKTVDVTDIIKELVTNNSLRVQAWPRNGFHKNGDPAPGRHKTLTIIYKLNGEIDTIEAIDPNWIEINIPE